MNINYKILLRSFTFILWPTVVCFLLIFLWILDWEQFKIFMLNKTGLAGFIRVFLFGLEVLVVYYFYQEGVKQEEKYPKRAAYPNHLSQYISENIDLVEGGEYSVEKIGKNKFKIEYK